MADCTAQAQNKRESLIDMLGKDITRALANCCLLMGWMSLWSIAILTWSILS